MVKDGYVEALTGQFRIQCVRREKKLIVACVRTGPGLGIQIDEALVRETSQKYVEEKAWRNDVWTGPDGSLREW